VSTGATGILVTLLVSVTMTDYLICRSEKTDDYSVWRIDITGNPFLHCVTGRAGARFNRGHQLISIGNYVLEWGPIILQNYSPCFPYRLFRFDPTIDDPLGVDANSFVNGNPKPTFVSSGLWPKKKFWGTRPDFGNPDGPAKAYDSGDKLMLLPLGTFILNVIPTTGRGTFKLFSFSPQDPTSPDPLYDLPASIAGAFGTIQYPRELIPLGNYVLDWLPYTGEYCLWSFDPMNEWVLARPAIQEGQWKDIGQKHKLVAIGEHVLDWDLEDKSYRLWRFNPRTRDPNSHNPLAGPERWGPMPARFQCSLEESSAMTLTCIQGTRPIHETAKNTPGSIDFMRSKIKHIVYYMLENRSFDNVCGWLYDREERDINFVGHDGPFNGAQLDMYNIDPDAPVGDNRVYLQKYGLNEPDALKYDPYHDMTDTMRQFFFNEDTCKYDGAAYGRRRAPHMRGFVWNQGNRDTMKTFTPETLPILNGLARAFAVSDEWFCSMPGATDSQRAFALTGSALGQLNNFMNGPQYTDWSDVPHRASIWKLLWANGFDDWKIYNSVLWNQLVLSYQLFLKGQVPAVDKDVSNYLAGQVKTSKYIGTIDQFKEDAKRGALPGLSFLEPVWIPGGGSSTAATSYHPFGGGGTGPGEVALNEIYEALKNGPAWDATLLVITFDEHGGFFDHVPPPYAKNPWPNDESDGFRYDLMGVRVPTILVSPWIKERTVFRSPGRVKYDSTSILATVLRWRGIPRARWGLGERTHHAPTFEGVFQCEEPRREAPALHPRAPAEERREQLSGLTVIHHVMVPRLVHALLGDKLPASETRKISAEILSQATDEEALHMLINSLSRRSE
jgi:phospholipase C